MPDQNRVFLAQPIQFSATKQILFVPMALTRSRIRVLHVLVPIVNARLVHTDLLVNVYPVI